MRGLSYLFQVLGHLAAHVNDAALSREDAGIDGADLRFQRLVLLGELIELYPALAQRHQQQQGGGNDYLAPLQPVAGIFGLGAVGAGQQVGAAGEGPFG